MPSTPSFLRIPFRLEYCMKFIDIYGDLKSVSMAHVKNIPYGKALIDAVLADNDVRDKEMHRVAFKLDPYKEPKFYSSFKENEAAFYQEIITDAAKAQIALSVNEIQAFYAFSNSIGAQIIQAGVFGASERVSNYFAVAMGLKPTKTDETRRESYLQVKKESDKIQIIYSWQIADDDRQEEFDSHPVAIKSYNTYSLAEDDEGSFTVTVLEDEQLCLFDSALWMTVLIPNGLAQLKNSSLTDKDFFILLPLLTEISFRAKFFEKLIQQPIGMQLKVFEYIDIYCGSDANLNQSIRKDYSMACNKYMKSASSLVGAQCSLEALLTQKLVPESQVEAVITLIESINALSPAMKAKNHDLLAIILTRSTLAISCPHDADNMQQYQALIRSTEQARLIKVAVAITMIVASVALMAFSIVAAVASFGASSVLSGLGVFIGMNAISQSLTILSAVAAMSGAVYSATMLPGHGLPQVTNAAKAFGSFWQAPKEKAAEVSPTVEVKSARPA